MRWLNAGIAALVAYVFGVLFHVELFTAAIIFIVVFVILSLTGSGFGGIWNSGLWTTLPVRRLVGAVADAAMILATAALSWWLVTDVIDVPALTAQFIVFANRNGNERFDPEHSVRLIQICTVLAFFVPFKGMRWYKTLIGRAAAPLAHLVRSRFVGMGGSSSFGGLFNDWAHPHRPGQLMLGGSIYSPGWIVGRSDDRHFITCATRPELTKRPPNTHKGTNRERREA